MEKSPIKVTVETDRLSVDGLCKIEVSFSEDTKRWLTELIMAHALAVNGYDFLNWRKNIDLAVDELLKK